jgi:hypothetical protein
MSRTYRNLYQLFASHSDHGIGFKIWKRDWPAQSYIYVSKTDLTPPLPKVWGHLVWRGAKQGEQLVNSPLKRGVWRFIEAKAD